MHKTQDKMLLLISLIQHNWNNYKVNNYKDKNHQEIQDKEDKETDKEEIKVKVKDKVVKDKDKEDKEDKEVKEDHKVTLLHLEILLVQEKEILQIQIDQDHKEINQLQKIDQINLIQQEFYNHL